MYLYTIINGVLTIPAVSYRPNGNQFYVDPLIYLRARRNETESSYLAFPMGQDGYSFLTECAMDPYYGQRPIEGTPILGEYNGKDFFVEQQRDYSRIVIPTLDAYKVLYARATTTPLEQAAQAALMLTDDADEIFTLAYQSIGHNKPPLYHLKFKDLSSFLENTQLIEKFATHKRKECKTEKAREKLYKMYLRAMRELLKETFVVH